MTLEKSLVKVCPQCGSTFYAYQHAESPKQPMKVDPMPHNGFGVRETCGDPVCWDLEDNSQFLIRKAWRDAHPKPAAQVAPTKRRLV